MKPNKICSVVLCIGMLSLNTLSSCTATKQKTHINPIKITGNIIKSIISANVGGSLLKNLRNGSTNTGIQPRIGSLLNLGIKCGLNRQSPLTRIWGLDGQRPLIRVLENGCIKTPKRLAHNGSDTNMKDNSNKYLMGPVLFKGGIFAFDPSFIKDFNPSKSVATCYIVCNGKILLLKRNDLAAAGSRWCMPGGKLEQDETPLQGAIRETKEETGIVLLPEEIKFVKTICVRMDTPKLGDYRLYLFKAVLPKSQPSDYTVTLNQEHMEYVWIDTEKAQKELNLIPGGKEILEWLMANGY